MHQHTHQVVVKAPEKLQPGVWSKIGGEALTFAVVFHVVLLIIATIWMITIKIPESPTEFISGGEPGGGDRGVQTASQNKKLMQIAPSHDVKRVVAEGALSNLADIRQGIDLGEQDVLKSLPGGGGPAGMGGSGLGSSFGSGDGNGSRWGRSDVSKRPFGPLPPVFSKRCSKDDRAARMRANGGTPACEDAVLKALRWFKTQQKPDGSWEDQHKTAMTGLVLLAYFGHCETVDSREFGETVAKGIVFLIDHGMKNNGLMGADPKSQPFCYEHAIATYALAEAATLCQGFKWPLLKHLEAITQKAGQIIIDSQNKNGGWAYQYAMDDGHTDLSIVGWQLQALKACSHVTSVKFNGMADCVSKGLNYVNSLQGPTGNFGYNGPGGAGYQPLTGVGMLCNQMWDKGKSPQVAKAAKQVLENVKFDYKTGANLYAAYYESQAMMQRGGDDWKKYNNLMREQLVGNQLVDGSWGASPGSAHVNNNVFSTALCTMMLEVYYRFLSTDGGAIHKGRAGFP
jgi:hypothetical protein